jgi:hypothetical protein
MAKTAQSKTTPSAADLDVVEATDPARRQPTEEEIAVRAYHIYLERGGAEGDPTEDWLQAERELADGR